MQNKRSQSLRKHFNCLTRTTITTLMSWYFNLVNIGPTVAYSFTISKPHWEITRVMGKHCRSIEERQVLIRRFSRSHGQVLQKIILANTNNQNQSRNWLKRCDRFSIWKIRKNRVQTLPRFWQRRSSKMWCWIQVKKWVKRSSTNCSKN